MVTGLPGRKDYAYRGTGASLSKEEAARRLANGTASPSAATRPVISPGRPERFGPEPKLRGAVKVAAFPTQSLYPFREIAEDGGVWKLDPAAFTRHSKPPKLPSVRAAAAKWATEHGMKAKTVIDGGHLYVQFTKATP